MKNLKLLFLVLLALTLTQTAFSQRRIGGNVIEVIDGKTAVIELQSGGRMNLVLQFIETPEPEQLLYQTVKEHLQGLILNRYVEFVPRGLLSKGGVGQLFLNGVDISQQMLRDGAAWYAVMEKSGQNPYESKSYQDNELQAKTEKRGVWSIENLKPAWELRAEKEEIRRQVEKAKQEALEAEIAAQQQQEQQEREKRNEQLIKSRQKTGFGLDMWSNIKTSDYEDTKFTGLQTISLPEYKIGYITTSGGFLNLDGDDSKPKIESRSLYVYPLDQSVRFNGYVIGFLSQAKGYNFAESNNLTIAADGQKFEIGPASRFFRQTPYTAQELLLYKIDPKALTKIAAAKNLEITLGKFSGNIANNYQSLIKDLLEATK